MELAGVLTFVEYQHKTLATPEPTAAHAAWLAGLAGRVAPMADRLEAPGVIGGQGAAHLAPPPGPRRPRRRGGELAAALLGPDTAS